MWIAPLFCVLISRCAWHPRTYGHSKLLGVSRWLGWRVEFTDGICPRCATRLQARRSDEVEPAAPSVSGRTSEVVVVALGVMTGLVLIARPTNDAPPPLEQHLSALPRVVAAAPPAVVERPVKARARRSHPVRLVASVRRPWAAPPIIQSP
jgi:hypothetical protein